jgi:predicted nucleic acid-binding protein
MAKLAIDSSVWIDFFNNKNSREIEHLKMLLIKSAASSPVIIFPVIMQEVLQGIENDRFFNLVKENLEGFDYFNYDAYGFAIKAAQLYRSLRKKGVTIKKTNDCLIASLCIEYNIPLFHKDKDFDNIAKYSTLKIYKIGP